MAELPWPRIVIENEESEESEKAAESQELGAFNKMLSQSHLQSIVARSDSGFNSEYLSSKSLNQKSDKLKAQDDDGAFSLANIEELGEEYRSSDPYNLSVSHSPYSERKSDNTEKGKCLESEQGKIHGKNLGMDVIGCFTVEDRIANVQSWLEKSRRLCKYFTVGTQATEITFHECKLFFSENTFKQNSTVILSIEIDSKMWPKDQVAVSPLLHVYCSASFEKPVKVKMSSWYVPNDSKSPVNVLHRRDGSTRWDNESRTCMKQDRAVTFFALDFSPYVLGVDPHAIGNGHVVVGGLIFPKEPELLQLAFYVDDIAVREKVMLELNPPDSKITSFSPVSAQLNQSISVQLTCLNSRNIAFLPPEDLSIKLNDEFLREHRRYFSVPLENQGQTQSPHKLRIKCEVLKESDVHNTQIISHDFRLVTTDNSKCTPDIHQIRAS